MSEDQQSWEQVLASFAKAAVNEAIMPVAEKLIPQGASELAQALHAGNAFVAYGPTNAPVGMEAGHSVHGPEGTPDTQQQPGAGPSAETQAQSQTETSYASMLSTYAAKAQEQQQTRENQR